MKKYIYTKGAETVTVESDGLGKINDFIVIGVIAAKPYPTIIAAGFNFKMGDTATIASMQNVAKMCGCKIECYEGGKLIANETNDYTA